MLLEPFNRIEWRPQVGWPIYAIAYARISRNSFRSKAEFSHFHFLRSFERNKLCLYKYEKQVLPISMTVPVHHAFFLLGPEGTLLIALSWSDDEATHPKSDGSAHVRPRNTSQASRSWCLPSRRYNIWRIPDHLQRGTTDRTNRAPGVGAPHPLSRPERGLQEPEVNK